MPSGQGKSFVFYTALLLVAGSSVVFGLDWTAAPLPPMPETPASVQAAKLAAHIPPPVKPEVEAAIKPSPVVPASAPPRAPAAAVVDQSPRGTQDTFATSPIITPERAAVRAGATQPKCDVAACTAAYRSFRASDCTWQPYEGPRRFCDKGHPPSATAVPAKVDIDAAAIAAANAANAAAAANAAKAVGNGAENTSQSAPKCNIEACKQAYFTFNPTDCTYQPSDGPRRFCDKGLPPEPAHGAAASPSTNSPPVSPKCDIEACTRAYFTFNPADCTYQPSDGPRRLCTKGTPPRPREKAAATPVPARPAPGYLLPPGLIPSGR